MGEGGEGLPAAAKGKDGSDRSRAEGTATMDEEGRQCRARVSVLAAVACGCSMLRRCVGLWGEGVGVEKRGPSRFHI